MNPDSHLCIYAEKCDASIHCPHGTPHEPDRWKPCTTPSRCEFAWGQARLDARCTPLTSHTPQTSDEAPWLPLSSSPSS